MHLRPGASPPLSPGPHHPGPGLLVSLGAWPRPPGRSCVGGKTGKRGLRGLRAASLSPSLVTALEQLHISSLRGLREKQLPGGEEAPRALPIFSRWKLLSK